MLRRLPVSRLSTHTTLFPSASSASHKCDPTNPAPPVTNTRIDVFPQSSRQARIPRKELSGHGVEQAFRPASKQHKIQRASALSPLFYRPPAPALLNVLLPPQ